MHPFRTRSSPTRCVPRGERIYAIGDVHGELELLSGMLSAILDDSTSRGPSRTTIVLLGDIIDRGPGAAALLRGFAAQAQERLVILRGNHETAMVAAYRGDEEAARFWLQFGGAATLAGFGIPQAVIAARNPAEVIAAMRERIDPGLIDWLDGLPLSWSAGDYFFAHAGVRPGIALAEQEEQDLLWIRQDFLDSRRDHSKVVVHGHTIEPGAVRLRRNRIGLDTGAHEHGVLSALGLEGDGQWTIQARRPEGTADDAEPTQTRFEEVSRLLTKILDGPESRLVNPVPSRYSISVTPDQPSSLPAGLRGAGGMVPVAAALGLSLAAGALAIGMLQREPASPAPPHLVEASLRPPAALPSYAARSPVVALEGQAPALPAALQPMGESTTRQVEASARQRRSPTLAATARREVPQGSARIVGPPVDPYSGRVAQPLTGGAQREALLADQIATRELNRQQIASARDTFLGPAVDDAVLAATTQASAPDDGTGEAQRSGRRQSSDR